jgi:hypothetical protein
MNGGIGTITISTEKLDGDDDSVETVVLATELVLYPR